MKKLFKVMAAAACALSLTACGGSSKKSDTLVVGAEELTGTFSPRRIRNRSGVQQVDGV